MWIKDVVVPPQRSTAALGVAACAVIGGAGLASELELEINVCR